MNKLEQLKNQLRSYQKVAIAYSGGVDSNFLFALAQAVLGRENVLAIFCEGAMIAPDEKQAATALLEGALHEIIPVDVLAIEQFTTNDKQRCYHCKKTIMTKVVETAKKRGFTNVLDGQNHDDSKSYRPGSVACLELGIISPLASCALTKQEIRAYSKELGIATYNKPANACLASRFDYNVNLSAAKLERVGQGEAWLKKAGLTNLRLRVQDDLARIEVEPADFAAVIGNPEIVPALKKLGFRYVTLDLAGLKSGGYDEN